MMRPHGKVDVSLVVFLAAISVAILLIIRVAPYYSDNMDVTQAMAATLTAFQVNPGTTDEDLIASLAMKVSRIGTHVEDDGYGNVSVKEGLGLKREQVTVQRDPARNVAIMRVDYDKVVDLHPIPKKLTLHFHPEKEAPMAPHN
jgi:hypothetical protein